MLNTWGSRGRKVGADTSYRTSGIGLGYEKATGITEIQVKDTNSLSLHQ